MFKKNYILSLDVFFQNKQQKPFVRPEIYFLRLFYLLIVHYVCPYLNCAIHFVFALSRAINSPMWFLIRQGHEIFFLLLQCNDRECFDLLSNTKRLSLRQCILQHYLTAICRSKYTSLTLYWNNVKCVTKAENKLLRIKDDFCKRHRFSCLKRRDGRRNIEI
jgi:hypothetical protein